MFTQLQNPFSLVARLLLAALFLPAGIAKLTGFEGTVGYITSVGLPAPTLAAAAALILEIAGGIGLIIGLGTRFAALALAFFYLGSIVHFSRVLGSTSGSSLCDAITVL